MFSLAYCWHIVVVDAIQCSAMCCMKFMNVNVQLLICDYIIFVIRIYLPMFVFHDYNVLRLLMEFERVVVNYIGECI